MIRPLMVAKYSESANVEKLSQIYNLVLRFNLSLLIVPIGILVIAGVPLLDLMTGGKYGSAAWILAGMLLVLVAEGTRVLLTLVVQAVEKNQYLAISNTILSASLLIAFPLLPIVGVWSVVIANLVGTTVANITLMFLLRRAGFAIRTNWGPFVLIVLYAALPGAVVWTTMSTLGWESLIEPLLAVLNFVAAFALLYWFHPPFNEQERGLIKSVLRGRKKNAQPIADTGE
jgi:O-antigen/teichoic acid export membrane protein